jgi:hypothetical protein
VDKMTHNVELTSAEIGNLWTQYIHDSLTICILLYVCQNNKESLPKERDSLLLYSKFIHI